MLENFSFGPTNGLDYGFPICFFPQTSQPGVGLRWLPAEHGFGTRNGLILIFEESAGMVPVLSTSARRIPEADTVATGFGVGRLVLSGALFAAPTTSVRMLGVDSASAKRMVFLVRMAAVRDMGLGVGTLASRNSPQLPLWLAIAAVADGVDALAVAAAAKQGVTRGPAAVAAVVTAATAALVGGRAALQLIRR